MTANRAIRGFFCITAILLAIGSGGAGVALDAPPLFQPFPKNVIFPKSKDIVVEQTEEEKKITEKEYVVSYPLGKIPEYTYTKEEGDYYHLKFPMPGRVKKSEFYTMTDLKRINADTIKASKDDWMKFVFASYYLSEGNAFEAFTILGLIEPENRNSTEVRILRARVKLRLKFFESAIMDVAPIVNSKARPGNSRPSNVRLINVYALVSLNKNKEAAEELKKALAEIDGTVPEWLYHHTICNYKLGNYEEVLRYLGPDDLSLSFENSYYLWWIKARCLVLIKTPEYDYALKILEVDDMIKAPIGTAALLDAAIIHATRVDLAKRNGKRALSIIASLKKSDYYCYYEIDATMAEALAYLETGKYDEANQCMADLKTMYVNEEDFPYLKQLEKAIRLKQKFVPKGRMPLIREKYLSATGS